MIDLRKPFGWASALLLLSALLHLVVLGVTLGEYLEAMLAGAVLWTACALLLQRGNRWFAGLVFFLLVFAGLIPFGFALSEDGPTAMVFAAITAADWLAAALLFGGLWRAKPATV